MGKSHHTQGSMLLRSELSGGHPTSLLLERSDHLIMISRKPLGSDIGVASLIRSPCPSPSSLQIMLIMTFLGRSCQFCQPAPVRFSCGIIYSQTVPRNDTQETRATLKIELISWESGKIHLYAVSSSVGELPQISSVLPVVHAVRAVTGVVAAIVLPVHLLCFFSMSN